MGACLRGTGNVQSIEVSDSDVHEFSNTSLKISRIRHLPQQAR